jgi:hypothetical protein
MREAFNHGGLAVESQPNLGNGSKTIPTGGDGSTQRHARQRVLKVPRSSVCGPHQSGTLAATGRQSCGLGPKKSSGNANVQCIPVV